MVPAQRPRGARAVLLATLLACVAFASLGAFAASAGAVDQAGFDAAQAGFTAAQRDAGAKAAEPAVDPSGPIVTLSAPALTTSTAKTASFKVSWSATPPLPSGGYDAFRVEYREPGVDYWLTWLPATGATSATFPGEPGHAYVFRAAAAKSGDPSTVGPWSAEKSSTVPADESAFAYLKTWTRTSASSAYFGKIRSCATKGATATYRFKGTKAALIAPRGRALGKVAVYVRSATATGWTSYKLVKTIDLYAKTARARVATTFGDWDPAVERQVKLLVTGTKNRASTSTKVSLDGLAVYGAPRTMSWHPVVIQPSTPTVVITDPLQLTASIDGCVDQRVEWSVYRIDRYGAAHYDEAGSISADGLYTAPALPTTTSGEDTRHYYVTARGLANPDEVYGTKEITVALGPPPVVDAISPLTAPEGSSITLTGRNFTDHGGVPKVLFQGVEATVTSYTDTVITALVPGGWQTWSTSQQMYVWVETWGQGSDVTTSHLFTVTGIKPMPPSPWYLNDAGETDDNASVGDTLRFYGHGFSPIASQNVVRFGGGALATGTSYVADPYSQDLGALYVPVPAGAASGALTFQRLDGDGRWSTADLYLEVKAPTVPTAALHECFGGFVTGPEMVRNGSWGNEEWLLQGNGFANLRIFNYSSTTPGVFWLDLRRNGVTVSRIMRAISDTVAVPHRNWGEQIMMPDEIFAGAQPGDTVEIRIRGDELTNRYERSSAWVSVSLGERPVYGAIEHLPAATVGSYWGPEQRIAKDSWLRITNYDSTGTHLLSAPGLWAGILPIGTDGIATKLVRLDTPGSYTITNQTTDESTVLIVGDVGEYVHRTFSGESLLTEGLLMDCAGATVDVPAGALSADDLGNATQFTVVLYHDQSDALPWDPTLTDGDHMFTLDIWPYVTKLLKPITITVPFAPDGRTTTPFLGMWDESSSLYYDFGVPASQIDTVERAITYVLPAGDYVHPLDYYAPALKEGVDPAELKTAPLSGVPFNAAFRKVGAVSSKVTTSGEGFVWHPDEHPSWGIRVDAVTDPTSSSYVPPEKAQEVLDIAAATWVNLAGKGWSEPEAMITITVRDYGDPGVYQGSTTKGVFGQPWVYVNSRLTMGQKLDTAVAHEMAHVFQRQLTTNITTKWIDEATAEWVAWDTLGTGSDLKASFEVGCDFPTVQFPTGFWAGYTAEQAYGAGAFIIWMADTYGPASVMAVYDNLAYYPQNWYDSAATFSAATGRSLAELTSEFADEFWLQTYDPIKTYTWSSTVTGRIEAFPGVNVNVVRPANSSGGYAVGPSSALRATLQGWAMVARAPGLPVGARVDVYRDSALTAEPPAAPVKIGTLTSDVPVLDLGTFDGTVGCYRLVAVPPTGAGLSLNVTVEAVRLASISPLSVPKAGGTIVTLTGSGFGDQKGIVMVGPAIVTGAAVSSWNDGQIVFTMPNMGTETGAHAVDVRPVIGGDSNAMSISVY